MDCDRHAESYSYIRSIGDTLKYVTKPGSFANGGPFLFPPPGLKIKGVKSYVGLPVGLPIVKIVSITRNTKLH